MRLPWSAVSLITFTKGFTVKLTEIKVQDWADDATLKLSDNLLNAAWRFVVRQAGKLQPPAEQDAADEGLLNAAAAQVANWAWAGITDPHKAAVEGGSVKSSASIDGASISYADSATAVESRRDLLNRLCDDAVYELQQAGYTRRRFIVKG